MPAETRYSVSKYMNGDDDDIPTSSEEDNEMWEEEFFASISSDQPPLEQEELDDATFDLEPPPPKIMNFSKAIHSLEDVRAFLDSKGYSNQATVVPLQIWWHLCTVIALPQLGRVHLMTLYMNFCIQ